MYRLLHARTQHRIAQHYSTSRFRARSNQARSSNLVKETSSNISELFRNEAFGTTRYAEQNVSAHLSLSSLTLFRTIGIKSCWRNSNTSREFDIQYTTGRRAGNKTWRLLSGSDGLQDSCENNHVINKRLKTMSRGRAGYVEQKNAWNLSKRRVMLGFYETTGLRLISVLR